MHSQTMLIGRVEPQRVLIVCAAESRLLMPVAHCPMVQRNCGRPPVSVRHSSGVEPDWVRWLAGEVGLPVEPGTCGLPGTFNGQFLPNMNFQAALTKDLEEVVRTWP